MENVNNDIGQKPFQTPNDDRVITRREIDYKNPGAKIAITIVPLSMFKRAFLAKILSCTKDEEKPGGWIIIISIILIYISAHTVLLKKIKQVFK